MKGIVLTDVPTDMPAYLCGLRVGDLVLQVHCKDTQNKQMFKESLKGVIAGDKIPILVKRKKKFLTVMLTVGAQGFSFKSIESYRYQAQVYDEDWRENLREEDSDDE